MYACTCTSSNNPSSSLEKTDNCLHFIGWWDFTEQECGLLVEYQRTLQTPEVSRNFKVICSKMYWRCWSTELIFKLWLCRILMCESVPRCCCLSPSKATLAFAGLVRFPCNFNLLTISTWHFEKKNTFFHMKNRLKNLHYSNGLFCQCQCVNFWDGLRFLG